jgi:hypothetical protein
MKKIVKVGKFDQLSLLLTKNKGITVVKDKISWTIATHGMIGNLQ